MTIKNALNNLSYYNKRKIPIEEIECIRNNKAEAVPVLLEYIKYACR